jgi:hypothetical protein
MIFFAVLSSLCRNTLNQQTWDLRLAYITSARVSTTESKPRPRSAYDEAMARTESKASFRANTYDRDKFDKNLAEIQKSDMV